MGLRLFLLLGWGLVWGCRPTSSSSPELVVLAASSLREGFEALRREFQTVYPEVRVSLVFAGSQVLRLQLEQGAPADVFASANLSHIEGLVGEGLITSTVAFAASDLALVVPRENPSQIWQFSDLARAKRVVIGSASTPVGEYTRSMWRRTRRLFGAEFMTRVERHIVSEEVNVRMVRAKVEMGEADAAIVYRTDALASSRVRAIPIPPELNVRALYVLGVHTQAEQPIWATHWVRFAVSEAGLACLERVGFSTPNANGNSGDIHEN